MTTMSYSSLQCPICKTVSRYQTMMSSNQFGSCDLDTRPPEMFRSTMHTWVQKCPKCGYAAGKMTDKPLVDEAFIKTEEYLTTGGIPFASELAKSFFQLYLTYRHAKDARNAFWSALQAAWASDDADDAPSAAAARKLALEQLDRWEVQSDQAQQNALIKADLLRRIGEFDAAKQSLENAKITGELLKQIARAIILLCEKRDAQCHTVQDALQTLKGDVEE